MVHFKIPKFKDVDELLAFVAKRSGFLKRGGIPDSDKAARVILHQWNSGKIKYCSEPPAVPVDSAVTEGTMIVSELAEQFKYDEEVLEGVMDVRPSIVASVPTVKFVSAADVEQQSDVALTETREYKPKSAGTDVSKASPDF
jgi:nuclear GTP-binding protein